MKLIENIAGLTFGIILCSSINTFAQGSKIVGGSEMLPDRNIVENTVNSKDHTILLKAVKTADLIDELEMDGPFTVFAPTNSAFNQLPDEDVYSLLNPSKVEDLQSVLTYHVIEGNLDKKALKKKIRSGKGEARLATLQGDQLLLTKRKGNIIVTDFHGNEAIVTIGDVHQKNGVIHVIDSVLIPQFSF